MAATPPVPIPTVVQQCPDSLLADSTASIGGPTKDGSSYYEGNAVT